MKILRKKSLWIAILFGLSEQVIVSVADARTKPSSQDHASESTVSKDNSEAVPKNPQPLPPTPQPVVDPTWKTWPTKQNWRSRVSVGIDLGGGPDMTLAAVQGYFELALSGAFDIYDGCPPSKTGTCLRFHVLFPGLGTGYYPRSQLPFFQAYLGPGIQVVAKGWLGILFQGGFGFKVSPIGNFNDQDGRDQKGTPIPGNTVIGALDKRDPKDSLMPIGWFQAGISFDLGRLLKTSSSRGFHLQITAKIQNAPSAFGSPWNSIDLAFLVGARYHLPN